MMINEPSPQFDDNGEPEFELPEPAFTVGPADPRFAPIKPLKVGFRRRAAKSVARAASSLRSMISDQITRFKNPHLEKHSDGTWFDTRPENYKVRPEIK